MLHARAVGNPKAMCAALRSGSQVASPGAINNPGIEMRP